jgi:hypothetical protein
MKTRTVLKSATTWMIVMVLLLVSISFTPAPASNAEPAAYADEAEIAEGARQFDEAVRDIEGLLKSDLSTERGVRDAAAVLKRNEKKLAQVEKKALHAALRVAAFEKGLKDEAARRQGGAEELAKELESNHDLIGNIPGAEDAAKAIRESTRPAAETLQRVAEALKKAGDEGKAKNNPANLHHANLRKNPEPEAQGFCGSYQYICDLLAGIGQYYLRSQLRLIAATGRKASCVLNAYSSYSACLADHWWDLAYCNSRLTYAVSKCLSFA